MLSLFRLVCVGIVFCFPCCDPSYGAEAVLPSDLLHDSPRVANYVEIENELARQDSLDVLEEQRELALERSAVYQQDLR